MQTESFHRRATALLGLALFGLAAPQASARDLRMAIGGAITSADPHFFNVTPNQTLASNVYDRLMQRSPDGRLIPGLALSLRAVRDTVWEVKLRPDVRWHDGRPFTAEDVSFTFNRARDVPGSPGSFSTYLRAIAEVRVLDPLTLELVTSSPSPDLPANLASVSIVSKHVGESTTTADYNAGPASIGTGAYRLVRFTPSEGAELRRNDDWWGPRQPWERVELRTIAAPASRTAVSLAKVRSASGAASELRGKVPRKTSRDQRLKLEGKIGLPSRSGESPNFGEGSWPFVASPHHQGRRADVGQTGVSARLKRGGRELREGPTGAAVENGNTTLTGKGVNSIVQQAPQHAFGPGIASG